MLRLVCEKCGRSGQLRVDKLIEQHGRNYMLPRLKDDLVRDCPRMVRKDFADWCGAQMPDLVTLK